MSLESFIRKASAEHPYAILILLGALWIAITWFATEAEINESNKRARETEN